MLNTKDLGKRVRRRVARWAAEPAADPRVLRPEQYENLVAAYEAQLDRAGRLPAAADPALRHHLVSRLLGTQIGEAYEIVCALHATRHLPGAVCEMGVAQGETSALIASEIRGDGRVLHLFDSFEGLPPPTEKDRLKDDIFGLGSMEAYAGTMRCPEDLVLARLKAVAFPGDRYVVHKGFFDAVAARGRDLPERVSFAYVDFDFYEPILQALTFVDPRMPAGGVILVDDYDWFSTGAKTAVHEFLDAANAGGERYRLEVADRRLGCFCSLTKTAA